MTTQPEALRLAQIIEDDYGSDWTCYEAAAELRRLYWSDLCAIDVINQLCTQRDALLAALKLIDKEFKKNGRQHWPEAFKARAAIAKAEGTA